MGKGLVSRVRKSELLLKFRLFLSSSESPSPSPKKEDDDECSNSPSVSRSESISYSVSPSASISPSATVSPSYSPTWKRKKVETYIPKVEPKHYGESYFHCDHCDQFYKSDRTTCPFCGAPTSLQRFFPEDITRS